MADLMKKLGWIAWCLTVIGWFLSPIISLLVNKIFVYLEFDASKKLKELEINTIPRLKHMLSSVEEQTVLRPAEEHKGSQSDLKILESMKMDLKSALYQAEGILDLLDYRRIEKRLQHGDDDSVWVENRLAAASAWIASCKESWFGRCIDVTRAEVMKGAQSMTRVWQFLIQGWRHAKQNFDLFCIAGAAVLQCVQSWYHQLGQLIRCVILRRSGALLPVSGPAPQPPCPESRGSEFVPEDPASRPAEEMVDEEEIVEETQVEEGEGADEIQDGEEGAMLEEIEEECSKGECDETSEEEIQEDDEEGKEGESTSLSILRYCARSMLTWFTKACFYRDWSYGIVGIKCDKKDASAVESLVPITQRIGLKNRIKCIEDILNTYRKSDLLNDENSSSGTTKDNGKASSSFNVKNSANESSSKQKEIDELSRDSGREVFGREEDRADISRMLRKGPDTNAASFRTSKPYSVIGIYGITGSGKTTLAQYVCDDEKKAGYFDPIMFIHVGKTLSVGDIFRDMMEQITQRRPPNDEGLKSLKTKLEKTLKDKCFLLVLDDLWVNDANQKELDILLDMLRLSAARSGSRVLVTSQKTDAAEALGAEEQISIPDLEEEVYLSLFMHHARPDDTSDDDGEYERIGRKIVNRLGRSPIAAVTVGKQLQRNKSISFWETTANLDVLNKTMGALLWSYQQLGVDIGRCFAYCSTFPRGYRLERDELVRIWIAQGFVNTRNNGTEELEDVGQRYCDELLTFSFLQRSKYSTKTFRIHDLLHELAERVSGSEFFRIELNDSPEVIPRGVHHLFIEATNGVEIAKKLVEVENLRTLIIKEPASRTSQFSDLSPRRRNHDSEKLLERLFMRLTKLRVLIIKQNCYAGKLSVPACIDRMKHLRYLGLQFGCPVSFLILPSTFSKLYRIEIIHIPLFSASRPEDMANLIYLRHIPDWLYFPNIGRLTSLQTMGSFRVKEDQGYELKQLKHLNQLGGTLRIEYLGIVGSKEEALEAQLTHKERLRELRLDFGGNKRQFGPDVEAEVLEGLCPPKHLEQLCIWGYRGSRYPTWMLSRHHPDAPKKLHRLDLWDCSSQLASIPEDSEVLIGLRELLIRDCGWDRLPQNMERLVSLEKLLLWGCNEIELLPTLPNQCLNTITIYQCRVFSATCKVEGHHNWHKIQHIHTKDIV